MYGENQQRISFNEFELDTAHRILLREGKPVAIYAKAFDLLKFLTQNSGRILTKDEILDVVWEGQFVEEANLSVQISALRKALGETTSEPRFLVTVPGKGYKFIADVNNGNTEIVIEKHKLSRIVVEEEITLPETSKPVAQISDATGEDVSNHRKFLFLGGAVSVLILFVTVFGIYQYSDGKNLNQPFHSTKLTRLTNSGNAECVAMSPDGNYVAYVLSESKGNSLRLRQIGTASDIEILKAKTSTFIMITFSPDGKYIYYSLFSPDDIDYQLFRVATLGGIEEHIPNVSTSGITFSPDSKRMAFLLSNSGAKYNSLTVSDIDGSNQQTIAKKEYPNTFDVAVGAISWSPDGNSIVSLVNRFEEEGNYTEIIGIDPAEGTEKRLSEKRWFQVRSMAWMKDGSSLLITAKDSPSSASQIWFVPNPKGEARKITNDLNAYNEVNVASNGETMVAIQTNSVNGIYVGEIGTGDYKEIVSEVGNLNPLVWTNDGEIIFRSSNDGVSNLWKMNADGSDRRQLTTNAEIDSRGLCMSPDGKFIVFASQRLGSKMSLWRVDSDGGNLTQLTDGKEDIHPSCSPNNETVVFQRGLVSNTRFWKVPISGGNAEPLSDLPAKWSAFSNDGEKIAYVHMSQTLKKWHISFFSATGVELPETLELPTNQKPATIFWSADNSSLYYIGGDGGVGNIWSLPLDGGEAKQITDFSTRWLSDFAISKDGKRLAVTRSLSSSDVVLIENSSK